MQHVIHTAAKCRSMHVGLQIFNTLQPCWHAAMSCGKTCQCTNTAGLGRYCTAGHLLDTLSSSWTPAGQFSLVNNGSWTLTPFGVFKKREGHGVSSPWQAQRHIKSFGIVRKDVAPKGACMGASSNAVTDTKLPQSCHVAAACI